MANELHKAISRAVEPMTATLVIERETPGAVRYAEVDASGRVMELREEGTLIGTLYIRKARLGNSIPTRITVTISQVTK